MFPISKPNGQIDASPPCSILRINLFSGGLNIVQDVILIIYYLIHMQNIVEHAFFSNNHLVELISIPLHLFFIWRHQESYIGLELYFLLSKILGTEYYTQG